MHDDGRRRQVETLRQGGRGDCHLEHIVAKEALDLFAIGCRQGTVVKSDAQAEAFEDRAVRSQPFFSQRNRVVENRGIGLEQGAQCATLMKIDDDVRERLYASPQRAEDQNGLSILNQPPGSG